MLKRLGATVTVANNGQEAVDAYTHGQFDIIFMDCQMPVLDGYEATSAIRIHESKNTCKHVPIIALTANAMTGDREKCIASGMDDHLAKPFKELQLGEALHRWVTHQVTTNAPTSPVAITP